MTLDSDSHATDQRWSFWAVLIGLAFSLQVVWSALLVALWLWRGRNLDLAGGTALARQWAILVTDCGLVLLILSWQRSADTSLVELGLDFSRAGVEIVIGLVSGIIIWAVAGLPLWVFDIRSPHPIDSALGILGSPSRFLLILVAALCEEIVWRGFVIYQAHLRYRLSVSVMLASVAYAIFNVGAAMEDGPSVLPWMAFVAFSLSAVYLWRRKLTGPMVAHLVIGLLG